MISSSDELTRRCAKLAKPDRWNLGVSIFILVGILVSYLPQHIRIIRRRSSAGLSPWFVLLGTASGSLALANILALPTSRADLACCPFIGPGPCLAAAMGVGQMLVQWMCFSIILLLFIVYFPRASPLDPSRDPHERPSTTSYTTAIIIGLTCFVQVVVLALLHLFLTRFYPDKLQTYASILGLAAAVLAGIQYFPQILTTWQLGEVASLSIPMMCIQTPGAFVWAASLAARLGWAGWSTWGVFVLTGSLQGCLLIEAIVFEVRNRRKAAQKAAGTASDDSANDQPEGRAAGSSRGQSSPKPDASDQAPDSDEQTPLLRRPA